MEERKCKIKPLGVADLLRVEQKLCCYVQCPSNILQGEYGRTYRLLVEETYVSITKETWTSATASTAERECKAAASEVIPKRTFRWFYWHGHGCGLTFDVP
ncbi:MAG: hypothetical protein U0176_13970 [Bacteroidia bacterium]